MDKSCGRLCDRRGTILRKRMAKITIGLAMLGSVATMAYVTDEVISKIAEVAVSGGTDTANPGTTCITLIVPTTPNPVASTCLGWIAIPNNNTKLVNAALLAKASASTVSVYYVADGASQHCPNRVFTPCAVISIVVK